jgi:hypothetical protein
LDFLLTELQTLEDSLKLPGATVEFAKFLQPMTSDPRDFSLLRGLRVPTGGFEQTVVGTLLKDDPVLLDDRWVLTPQVQRLFADIDILVSFYDDSNGVEPGTWTEVVLRQYCDRLSEALRAKKRDDTSTDKVWGWIGRAGALFALVGLMAIFPFGEAALGPTLATLIALSGSSAVILGVLTILHSLFDTLQKATSKEADARDQFFRLAQDDPDALQEIGMLLAQSNALRVGVAKGFLSNILTLGAASKLKVVAYALTYQGYYQDVETLFAPAGADD